MSAPTKSAAPVLAVLEALCGFAANGATNKDLAAACRTTPVAITRATQTLVDYGWCRKAEDTGRFYPTTQFTRLVFRVHDDFDRAIERMQEQRRAMTGVTSDAETRALFGQE